MITWIIFFMLLAAWATYNWIENTFFVEIGDLNFGPKPMPSPRYKEPDKYSIEYFQRLQKERVMDKDESSWELLLSNSNHYSNMPHCIIKTSSLELATYLLNTLSEAFKDNGYKSFSLYIKSTSGGVIVKEKSSGA